MVSEKGDHGLETIKLLGLILTELRGIRRALWALFWLLLGAAIVWGTYYSLFWMGHPTVGHWRPFWLGGP